MLLHCLFECRCTSMNLTHLHADLFSTVTEIAVTAVTCSSLAHDSMYHWCPGASEIEVDPNAGPTSAQLRVQFIRENPELLQIFAANLLPQMLQVYNGSVVSQVRLSLNLSLVRHSTMSHFLMTNLGGPLVTPSVLCLRTKMLMAA